MLAAVPYHLSCFHANVTTLQHETPRKVSDMAFLT